MAGFWITARPPVQTVAGGGAVEHREFVMGSVTYEVKRVYRGDRSREELIQQCVARAQLEQAAFDVTVIKEYNVPSGSVRRRREV